MNTDNSGPAYPLHPDLWGKQICPGLTKRELFAMAAMQGLAANAGHPTAQSELVANVAVCFADALLAELAK